MKTLYIFVRHLPTADDQLRVFTNPNVEVPLLDVDTGKFRAVIESIRALREGRHNDLAILSSHTTRATKTARLIADELPNAGCVIDARLANIAHRVWDGRPRPEVEASGLYRRWLSEPAATTFEGGESLKEVSTRIDGLLDGLGEGRDILFVSHTTPLQVLACRLLGHSLEQIWSFYFEPYAVSAVLGRTLVRFNDASGRKCDLGEIYE